MKKLILLLFIPLAITLNGCSSLGGTTAWSGNWIEKEMPPSQVVTNGDIFAEYKLSNGKTCSVGGYIDDPDASYYKNLLWQDFGWTLKAEGNWTAPYNARERKLGHLYINVKRGVAIYFYADRKWNVFRVKVND